jgi:hypothetical protein
VICAGAAPMQSMLPNTNDAMRRVTRATNGMNDP